MKRFYSILIMSIGLFSCSIWAHKPKGDLTYCTYCCSGAAGLGTDYCELVAPPEGAPKVVVVLSENNRFGDPVVRRSYPVDKSVVDSLQGLLTALKFHRLNGYDVNEPICGGHSYRIQARYASGDEVQARWYGHKIKDKAIAAYNAIEHFFAPWRERALKEAALEATVQRISEMETLFDRVHQAVRGQKPYPELGQDIETLRRYMDSGQWKEDFEADERGELPRDLKRGVLSEDGLYNLLSPGNTP